MLLIRTRLKIEQPPDVAVRDWRVVLRKAHEVQGQHWVRVYSPRHFTPAAAARYRYRRRSPAYLRRKQRTGRGGSPLVFSGDLRRDAVLNLVRGFPSRVKITRHVPAYANFRPKGNRPNLAAEQFAVTQEEVRDLEHVLDVAAQRELDAAPRKTKVVQA